jgi:hypothetical protein
MSNWFVPETLVNMDERVRVRTNVAGGSGVARLTVAEVGREAETVTAAMEANDSLAHQYACC